MHIAFRSDLPPTKPKAAFLLAPIRNYQISVEYFQNIARNIISGKRNYGSRRQDEVGDHPRRRLYWHRIDRCPPEEGERPREIHGGYHGQHAQGGFGGLIPWTVRNIEYGLKG
jgi:hypothetical protein